MVVTEGAEAGEVVGRRRIDPTGTLDGFGDDCGDRSGTVLGDDGLDGFDVHRGNHDEARGGWTPIRVEGGEAGGGGRTDGGAVVPVGAGDDCRLLRLSLEGPVAPDRLEGGVAGFGTSGGEEDRVEMVTGCKARQTGGEGDRRFVG